MTDDELCAELAGLGGIDPELLALPEMREMVLPVIRGDYELLSRYRPRPGELLSCPVSVFVGLEDVELSPEGAAAWGGRTSGPCEVVEFMRRPLLSLRAAGTGDRRTARGPSLRGSFRPHIRVIRPNAGGGAGLRRNSCDSGLAAKS